MIHNLFSTLPTFKNLGDLKPGLNVVLAQKTEGASSKQTRNRAGKTRNRSTPMSKGPFCNARSIRSRSGAFILKKMHG